MLPLLSVHQVSKTMGSKTLFSDLSLGIFPKEKTGLIGSNGAGKSTLLKIIAQTEKADSGEIHQQKNIRIAFATQDQLPSASNNILELVTENLKRTTALDPIEAEIRAAVHLSQAGFEDFDVSTKNLSGGWNKRLNLCLAISQEPDLLILDEPTNHLDWDGILWLESWLKTYHGSLLLVSHDRAFLNNSTNRIIEINRVYPDGYLAFNCNYEQFLTEKKKFIDVQMQEQARMANKARREVDWLRAGVKARTTKSRSRIERAHKLLDDLDNVKMRNSSVSDKSRIHIDTDERKTKKLIEFKNLALNYGDKDLIKDLNLVMGPKSCWGLLGDNGSGKTSLLKAIAEMNTHYTGTVFKAENLKVVYFDQKREQLPQDLTLLQFLGEGTDYCIFLGQSVHVASYASRFLFDSQKMHLKISQLSGGEQARLLVAKILLQPVDVLILDEPTNDLDIETIEVLEDTLENFEGLVLLVSHDRYFLNNLCTRHLAFKGNGDWAEYSEVNQWLRERNKDIQKEQRPKKIIKEKKQKKHIGKDQRKRIDKLKKDIEKLEAATEAKKRELDAATDHKSIGQLYSEHEQMEEKLLQLYSELENSE